MGEITQTQFWRASFPAAEMEDFRTNAWAKGTPERAEDLQPLFPTVLHALVSAAKLGKGVGITVVSEEDGESETDRSYAEILTNVRQTAQRLRDHGVTKGDRVLIVLPTGFEFPTCFFAIQLVGAIPVPVYPPMLLERLEPALERLSHISTHAGVRWCISNRQLLRILGDLAWRAKSIERFFTVEELCQPSGKELHAQVEPDPEAPGLIQYTSGSTGNPKGVLVAHKSLVANIHAMGQGCRVNRKDRAVSWLPLYHDMGLMACLIPVYWRFPMVLMSPLTFLARPETWLWAIHRHRATLTGGPNFGYGRCVKRIRPRDIEGLDLSSWRVGFNGAEPVNLRTVRAFVDRYKEHGLRETVMLPVYGLAENTLAVAFPSLDQPLEYEVVDRERLGDGDVVPAKGKGSTAIVSVGKAVPGHSLLIVNEKGDPVSERKVGHIVVSGPSLMQGYFRDPDATEKVIRDGWLWTGDLGYFNEGNLYITGRVKDLILIRGRNFFAEDLERVVERVHGIRPGGVVVFGIYDEQTAEDHVVVVCEIRPTVDDGRDELKEEVAERMRDHCGVSAREVVLVQAGAIPKTSSGKRQRALCKERFMNNTLRAPKLSKGRLAVLGGRSFLGLYKARLRGLFGRK